MKSFDRLIRLHRRTLFVLAVIAMCAGVNAAWQADWPNLLHEVGIGRGDSETVVIPRDPTDPTQDLSLDSKEALPHEDIQPDYKIPPFIDGGVPVISRIPTRQKVVFLTIDDGMTKSAEAPRLLAKYRIKAPMFLNDTYVKEKPSYFRGLTEIGMTVESHTVDHADMTTLGPDQQIAEICGNAAYLQTVTGTRPTLFRPPYGSYNESVLQSAAACGMRAAIMWSAKANGGSMQYQDGHTGLVPGDIVLMHFRPEFAKDFQAFIDAAREAGLQPENLEDWLQPPKPLPLQTTV